MSEVENSENLKPWAVQLFASLGIKKSGDAELVFERAGKLANQLAPNIRRTVRFILLFEGVAVLAPILWLLVVRHRWSASYVSYAVVVCTVLVIGFCWWLRWRGMNQSWSGARLVGEIARSGLATRGIPGNQTVEALGSAPTLQPLARWITGKDVGGDSIEEAKESYLKDRLEDQLGYYRMKLKQAAGERRHLSKVVTMSLDGALFLAVAGLAISFNEAAEQWLRLSGVDYILGFVGAALPLVAILMQLLGAGLELDRRTGRYAQQIEFLESAREDLAAVEDVEALHRNVLEVERILLGEVVEWYYQARNSEPYYRSKSESSESSAVKHAVKTSDRSWAERLFSGLGISAGFMGRVVFGRLLVVALSVVVTTGLISMHAPSDPMETSRLRMEDGRLLSSSQANEWVPSPDRAANGFLLIAHGLHDGVDTEGTFKDEQGRKHWMERMQRALQKKLKSRAPDICLVNWHLAARPAMFSQAGLENAAEGPVDGDTVPKTAQGWLQSVAGIRGQAEQIGELVGFKIAKAIRDGRLDQDAPMHLIGHSAGGFVVVHAAIVLNDLGLAPKNMRVTMLDTPMPVKAHLEKLLETTPIDFYRTSLLAQGVPRNGFKSGFTLFALDVPEEIDAYIGAHSYSHGWFIDSIEKGDKSGFARSPFAKEN